MNLAFQSLYVHVPFCRRRKCDYCSFYSVTDGTPVLRRAYLERLMDEFAEFAGRAAAPLQSVFIGGGTPSVLTPAELRTLLRGIRIAFVLSPDTEFSVECNPDSLNPAKIAALAEGGVNRVSLGVQTFSPVLRRRIGRRGSLSRLPELLDRLRHAGIANIGFDLMYALPGQTLADWNEDLRRALELQPEHLSTYALTLEEQTVLAKRIATTPATDELSVDMWELADIRAAAAGLRRYEISNLARPGRECRHNLEIWYGLTYLGCGPAACSFDGCLRWSNPPDIGRWLKPRVRRSRDPLPRDRRAAEILAFGLRTADGWRRPLFRARTGFDYRELRGEVIDRLTEKGLLETVAPTTPGDDEILRPTHRGLLFHDTVAGDLL